MAGRQENSQIGMFLLHASTRGATFLDRALDLPEEWTSDRVQCREAGIPDDVDVVTTSALARQMLARACAAGMPAQWVVEETIPRRDDLRVWLEERQRNDVLAVAEIQLVWVAKYQQLVGQVAARAAILGS